MPSVANRFKKSEALERRVSVHGYSSLVSDEDKNEATGKQSDGNDDMELSNLGNQNSYQGIINEENVLEHLKV